MVFSKEDKVLIKNFYETKGYGARKLVKDFPQKNWTKGGLDSLITKLRSTRGSAWIPQNTADQYKTTADHVKIM